MTNDDGARSLRALCQVANQQAAGWPGGLGGTARGGASALRGKRVLAFGLLGGSSLLALAFAAQQYIGEAATPDASLAAAVAAVPAAPVVLPVLPPPDLGGPVQRQGDDLLIDFDGVPLPEAVATLARATGTAVHDAELLQPSMLVTLHLRVRSVGEAWRQLLQGRAAFNIVCPSTGCQVVIAGERSLPAVAATRAGSSGAVAPDAAPAKPPTEEELSQPDGSC